MGLGKRTRLRVDQPTITGRTHPSFGRIQPLFAVIVAPLQIRPKRSFFSRSLLACSETKYQSKETQHLA
jgi:hypothetical protein